MLREICAWKYISHLFDDNILVVNNTMRVSSGALCKRFLFDSRKKLGIGHLRFISWHSALHFSRKHCRIVPTLHKSQ